jgi:hypothetical protein
MQSPGRPRLANLSPAELRKRAEDVRKMAVTATSPEIRDALERLGQRYEQLAEERERDT